VVRRSGTCLEPKKTGVFKNDINSHIEEQMKAAGKTTASEVDKLFEDYKKNDKQKTGHEARKSDGLVEELQSPRQCRIRVRKNHAVSTRSSTRAASARHLDVDCVRDPRRPAIGISRSRRCSPVSADRSTARSTDSLSRAPRVVTLRDAQTNAAASPAWPSSGTRQRTKRL
jgi:hypothetical protein